MLDIFLLINYANLGISVIIRESYCLKNSIYGPILEEERASSISIIIILTWLICHCVPLDRQTLWPGFTEA